LHGRPARADTEMVSVVLQVPAVEDPDFVAELTYRDGARLRLAGSADSAVAGVLGPALARVHDELRTRRERELVVDLRAVDSMIAACWRELVAWIVRLGELAPDERYRVRVCTSPAIGWQQHVVPALACFATDLVTVEG
jgi:hypothetical protein